MAVHSAETRIFSSTEIFAAFYKRAGFILRSPFLAKDYSDRERVLLEVIAKLPRGDYSSNMRFLKTTYPTEQLEELAKKVLHVAGRASLASTEKSSRSSSLSTQSGGSFSSDEGLPPLGNRGDPRSRRVVPPPPPPRVKVSLQPLSGVKVPRFSKAKSPERRAGSPPGIRKSPAIVVGGEVSQRKMLSPRQVLNKTATGLEGGLKKSPEKAVSPPPAVGGEVSQLRPVVVPGGEALVTSPRRESSEPKRRPLKKQRSFVETGSAVDLLKIPREYNIAVQGAICLKYLFPAAFQKLFPKEEDQNTVGRIIRSYGLVHFVNCSLERAVDEVFQEPPENLFSVLHRLGKQQTLSQIAKPPSLKNVPSLPKMFLEDPRLKGERLEELVSLMGKVRYQCLGIYTMMPKALRRGLDCFCASVYIKEMTGWSLQESFRVAFGGKYPSDEELDRLIREVTLSDFLAPIEMPKEAPKERSMEEVFSHPYLKYPILFRQLLKHMALFHDRHSFFGKQIEAVYKLKEECLLPHEAAVQRCFGKGVLEKHFPGEEMTRMVEGTLAELDKLSPQPAYDHPCLKTGEGIALLCEKSGEDLRGYFKRIQDVMRENPGMLPWFAVQAVFTRSALRRFFDSEQDRENGRELVQLIEKAAKS